MWTNEDSLCVHLIERERAITILLFRVQKVAAPWLNRVGQTVVQSLATMGWTAVSGLKPTAKAIQNYAGWSAQQRGLIFT